ncbi:MAG: radical SAM protein, partial [Thermoplasmata archaeon]
MVEVVESRCRRALSRTGVYGFEASLNPYVG